MRAKAAEDMDTLENEHTGEQRGPEVMPAKQQLQMPTAQLLAFEQVRGVRHTIAACVCCSSQIFRYAGVIPFGELQVFAQIVFVDYEST